MQEITKSLHSGFLVIKRSLELGLACANDGSLFEIVSQFARSRKMFFTKANDRILSGITEGRNKYNKDTYLRRTSEYEGYIC